MKKLASLTNKYAATISMAILLIIWQGAGYLNLLPKYIIPTPIEIAKAFVKNYQLLRLNNADDFRIFIEAFYSDQCNFEIFNSELLVELAKYKVSLPISVYYCDNN